MMFALDASSGPGNHGISKTSLDSVSSKTSVAVSSILPQLQGSGFQSYDPFAGVVQVAKDVDQESTTNSESFTIKMPIVEQSNGSAGGKPTKSHQRHSAGNQLVSNSKGSQHQRAHNSLQLDLNGHNLTSHSMNEHRGMVDTELHLDVTSPIKVVLNPREIQYDGSREAAQSPRAKASPPYAENWAVKTSNSKFFQASIVASPLSSKFQCYHYRYWKVSFCWYVLSTHLFRAVGLQSGMLT